MAELHLSERHLAAVRCVLDDHVPGVPVLVFGSGATGRRLKPFSDLDLVLCAASPLAADALDRVRDACSDSDLPFRVDVVERRDLTPAFLAAIEADGTVPPATAISATSVAST